MKRGFYTIMAAQFFSSLADNALLIAAIALAGGPAYDYREIAPENNADGGAPNGNIRVGFLVRTDRVDFVDRGSAGPLDATGVVTTLRIEKGHDIDAACGQLRLRTERELATA
jgi:predicted extracellular nuclease